MAGGAVSMDSFYRLSPHSFYPHLIMFALSAFKAVISAAVATQKGKCLCKVFGITEDDCPLCRLEKRVEVLESKK